MSILLAISLALSASGLAACILLFDFISGRTVRRITFGVTALLGLITTLLVVAVSMSLNSHKTDKTQATAINVAKIQANKWRESESYFLSKEEIKEVYPKTDLGFLSGSMMASGDVLTFTSGGKGTGMSIMMDKGEVVSVRCSFECPSLAEMNDLLAGSKRYSERHESIGSPGPGR